METKIWSSVGLGVIECIRHLFINCTCQDRAQRVKPLPSSRCSSCATSWHDATAEWNLSTVDDVPAGDSQGNRAVARGKQYRGFSTYAARYNTIDSLIIEVEPS